MNDNVKLWVEALRSGEYKQGRGTLGGPDLGYCCLGVACVVYEQQTGEELPKTHFSDLNAIIYRGVNLHASFRVVRDWLGLTSDNGKNMVNIDDEEYSLVYANDDLQLTFEEIADHIEAYYER